MRTYLKIVQAKIYVSISMNIEADQQSFNICKYIPKPPLTSVILCMR